MKCSTYLYKDIDGKMYMGPAWDYDWGYGNICMYNSHHLMTYDKWHTVLTGNNMVQVDVSGNTVSADFETNKDTVEYVEFIVNGRKLENEKKETLYNVTDRKAKADIPSYMLNRQHNYNMLQVLVYNKEHKLDDKDICFAEFDYEVVETPKPQPTVTPIPAMTPGSEGTPVPSKKPDEPDNEKPTDKPISEPVVTAAPVVLPTVTPSSSENDSSSNNDNNAGKKNSGQNGGIINGTTEAGRQEMTLHTGDAVGSESGQGKSSTGKNEKGLLIKGAKTVRRGKKLKFQSVKKGITGKVRWSVAKKYKKYIKLNKNSGNTISVVAKKKGKAVIKAVCGKYRKSITIKII